MILVTGTLLLSSQTQPQHDSTRPRHPLRPRRTAQPKPASKKSENSKKAAKVQSLRKKLQARRAAAGGPKGDFYSVGDVVKDEYGGLFMIDRYQGGKWIVVALGPKSSDKKNPFQKVIRKEIVVPKQAISAAIRKHNAISAGMCPELIFPYIPYLLTYPSGSSPALSSRRKNTGVNLK